MMHNVTSIGGRGRIQFPKNDPSGYREKCVRRPGNAAFKAVATLQKVQNQPEPGKYPHTFGSNIAVI